ncbi:MAG: 50S ribosomal protein L11 methyltransferase [Oligoflexia bacterium]|nr:50S ribosomal protein L11 methyltransferase [Oligoflexia bacterium]
MKNINYYLVTLEIVDREATDLTLGDIERVKESSMSQFNSSGIEEFSMNEEEVDQMLGDRSYSGGDLPYQTLLEIDNTNTQKKSLSLKFYFDSDSAYGDSASFVEYLTSFIFASDKLDKSDKLISINREKKLYEDWDKIWKEFYSPIWVSPIFEIVPSFLKENYSSDSLCPVYIYPGQGFGTGGHETTHLCLEFLSELCSVNSDSDSRVLDFGCGSGILGIAALKYAWKKGISTWSVVDLVDIDEKALENARINLDWNFEKDVAQKLLDQKSVNLKLNSNSNSNSSLLKTDYSYKLIFANILMNVLIQEKNFLNSVLEENGFLIISGLLKDQMKPTLDEYLENNSSLKLVSQRVKGDWGALLLQKKTR